MPFQTGIELIDFFLIKHKSLSKVVDIQFLDYFRVMYELVKQRSKGQVILFGIIIFTFVTAILKMAFRQSPSNLRDDMIQAANEINSHAPIIIDSTTRFDYVNALDGSIFQYNYTLTSLEASQVDTAILKESAREAMINQIRSNPKSIFLKENGIMIEVRYTDKHGKEVCIISIPSTEYGGK